MPWMPLLTDRAYVQRLDRYPERMTVRDMLTALQTLPRDAELLAFGEVEWKGGRADSPRG
jgi:hypothetical protein